MAKRPWESNWVHVRPLASGGQGTAAIVKRVGSDDSTEYVLKTLNKPRDPERRARMLREIQALRALGPPGIPQIVDSGDSGDGEAMLFIVTEYIDGHTLEAGVRASRMNLADAIALTEALLATVRRCHDAAIAHRDIKPDNIVLRGRAPRAPCLIDFGLSTSWSEDVQLTGSEQQVGNRFLALPEHATPGGDKRDPRSDLTACCGIFLYALTGRQPMTLVDHEGLKPHEREDVRERLSSIPQPIRIHLDRFFDRAFELRTSQRWQATGEIAAALTALREHMAAHEEFSLGLATAAPDAWSNVLIWTCEPHFQTYWVTRTNRDFAIQAARRGAFFSGGQRMWMWEQISTPITLSNQEDLARLREEGLSFEDLEALPKRAGHIESARLVDVESGVVAQVSVELLGGKGGPWSMLSDTIHPSFSVGNLLFAEQALTGFPVGAAHPMHGANFACVDLCTGETKAWTEPTEAKALVALLGDAAVSRLLQDAEAWEHLDRPSVENLSITKFDASYSGDGSLQLDFQLTTFVPYAFSDGAWAAYSRSAMVTSPTIPTLLDGVRTLPEAVRWFIGARAPRRFGWTAVGPERRDELLDAFQKRQGIPDLLGEYSLHRV